MKTTVVPAQITTVEDKIAGNLSFTQVALLITALIISGASYILILPKMHLSIIKIILICFSFLFFGGLSIRIKGKILVDWLTIFLRFALRPRIYLFTKNDLSTRNVALISREDEETVASGEEAEDTNTVLEPLSLPEQRKINSLLENPTLTFRFGFSKKGGIDVSLTKE